MEYYPDQFPERRMTPIADPNSPVGTVNQAPRVFNSQTGLSQPLPKKGASLGVKKQISSDEAFEAMVLFLKDYWKKTQSEEIATLLGGLALQSDGRSADPAYQQDWERAIKNVTS